MIFPDYIKSSGTIGVTAVSDGVGNELDKKRFLNGKDMLEKKGVRVQFTESVFQVTDKGRSADAVTRAKELNGLIRDKNVTAIVSAKGGNFLNEVMEYVDFEEMCRQPKWFQGYSDNTWLTYVLTTMYDIASVYGSNFGEFGMACWHESVNYNFDILQGKKVVQKSFTKYQNGFAERETGLEGYTEDTWVEWKPDAVTAKKGEKLTFSGRLIGGCLDVLMNIQGTRYDATEQFIEKYKDDGIIWYLETFESTAENMMMCMWKLRETGWFKYVKGFLFGRPLFYRASMDTSYEEAVMYALGSLNVPVVFDCDFGHLGPRFTLINGGMGTVAVEEGKGELVQNI